ncbi:DUF2764 family protein [Winogradskyella sp.]|uniref:DUF2764 family protein n=1 Tax=Winogradskyella sp. TaxID=1883156 RepID=UPI002602ABCF|nr:DUF2764 family protein [Winogradskyella sp.]
MFNGNLEYLISSLPNLSFSDSETVQQDVKVLFKKYASTSEASDRLVSILNEEASKYLSLQDFQKFESIQLSTIHKEQFQNSNIKVVSEFSRFMFQLKSELKTFRVARKSEESFGKISYELLGELPENPLKAEEYLLDIKWQKLDTLSIGHYSNLSALVLYKLKLEVLLRWWQFDAEVGFQVFQQSLNVA